MPLQQANSELSEKSGMLQAEKKILEDEIKQWKARTQVGEEKSSPAIELTFSCFCFVRNIDISSPFTKTTFHSILAFGEPSKRFRSRGVQTTAH